MNVPPRRLQAGLPPPRPARERYGRRLLVLALAVGLAAWPAVGPGVPPSWLDIAGEVATALERAAAAGAGGQPARALELVSEAYFDVFEERGMEAAIRRYVSVRRARQIERMFGGLRRAISSGADAAEVGRQVATLREALATEARELQRQGVTQDDLRPEPDVSGRAEAESATEVSRGAATELLGQLDEVGARYRGGAPRAALALLDRAYFELFEGQGLEAAIGAKTPARTAAIETRFVRIRGLVSAGASPETVAGEMDALRRELQEALALLSESSGPWQAVFAGALIIVREGGRTRSGEALLSR